MSTRLLIYFSFFTFLLTGFSNTASGNNKPDSLTNQVNRLTDSVGKIQNLSEKINLASQALNLARTSKDTANIAKALLAYSHVLFCNDKFEQTFDSASKALKYFEKFNDSLHISESYNILGNSFLRRADYFKAIECYEKSIKTGQHLPDSLMLANNFSGLGIIYYKIGKYDDAIKSFNRALKIFQNLKSKKNFSRIQGNLGLCYLEKNQVKQAKQLFFESLSSRIQLQDTMLLASIYDDLGKLYEKTNQLDSALFFFNKSHKCFVLDNSKHGVVVSSLALGRVNLKLGNLSKAIKQLTTAYSTSKQTKEDDLTMQITLELSEYYNKIGDNDKSRTFLKNYITYYEKIFKEKTLEKINQLQFYIETQRKEQENKLLQAEVAMQHLKSKQNRFVNKILIAFSVLLIIILTFTIVLTFKLRNKNKVIEDINNQLLNFNLELERVVKSRTSELSDALEKVKELERIKSAFMANISHEVRTPLNGILGLLDYILNNNVPKDEKTYLNTQIRSLGERLLRLVDDILELSKIETNQLDIKISECNVNTILSELNNTFQNSLALKNRNVTFRVVKSLPDNETTILTDAVRLKKIIFNLIENAFKFTHTGSIEVGYSVEKEKTLKIYVKDTGVGIPKNIQKRVFERFYRHISDESHVYYEGVGIGLTIAMGYALALAGRIKVDSSPGNGSTFYILLPYNVINTTNKAIPENWSNKCILVVEDDLISYQYIEALLKITSAKLIHVKNAEDAIEVCSINKNIDLIILDIQLPFMNGIDAARKLRKIGISVPIIAQSANAISSENKLCLEAGCDAFITKPIDPDELLSIIRNKLNANYKKINAKV